MVQLGEKDQGCKMISGLKKEYQKQASLCYKAQYEQKNSSVILKNGFKIIPIFQNTFNFKKKLNKFKILS